MTTKRSQGWKKIRYTEDRYAYCKNNCGKVCEKRNWLYCSEVCREDYSIRNFPAHARMRVFERDHGVCAICGLDTLALQKTWRDRETAAFNRSGGRFNRYLNRTTAAIQAISDPDYRALLIEQQRYLGVGRAVSRVSLWDADHIVPVVEGGGQCGLENLRTLCIPDHRRVTAELRKRLSKKGNAVPVIPSLQPSFIEII